MVQRLYLAKYIVEDVNTIHHDAALIVEDQNVKKIQHKSELSLEQIQNSEDLGDVVISPGLTNAHSHVALNSVKGLGYGTASALYDVMWGVEPALDKDSVYKLSLLGMVDAIRSGTTSINDHYFLQMLLRRLRVQLASEGLLATQL